MTSGSQGLQATSAPAAGSSAGSSPTGTPKAAAAESETDAGGGTALQTLEAARVKARVGMVRRQTLCWPCNTVVVLRHPGLYSPALEMLH